jgi:hypothetical protein
MTGVAGAPARAEPEDAQAALRFLGFLILGSIAVQYGHRLGVRHGYRRAMHDFTSW